MAQRFTSPATAPATARPAGFTLAEVLVVMVFMALMVLPLALGLGQGRDFSGRSQAHMSRNISAISHVDAADGTRPNFNTFYPTAVVTDGSNPSFQYKYQRQVSTASSNTLNRTVSEYVFNEAGAVYAKATRQFVSDTYVVDSGLTSTYAVFDRSRNQLMWDTNYDAGNVVPGMVSAGGSTTDANAVANTVEDAFYQSYRVGSPTLSYAFPVANGRYVVKLYFAEMNNTINGGANKRRADIAIEGNTVQTAYSVFETTGALYRAHMLNFPVTVSDGVLNVVLTQSATSNQPPMLNGISISRSYL